MDKNLKVNLGDQAVKGAVLGALAYFGDQAGLGAEQVAVLGYQRRSATREQPRCFR